jgi:hypothetical protein
MNHQKPKYIRIHISHLLTEQEWRCIEIFQKRVQQLAETSLLSSNKTKISAHFNFEVGKPLEFQSNIPLEKDFKELVYAFRFFYLQTEPCQFLKVVNIISKHSSDNDIVVQKMRDYKNRWKRSLFDEKILFFDIKNTEKTAGSKVLDLKTLDVKKNGEKLAASKILDLWYNAEYSHSDENKEKELEKLNQCLSFNLSKHMFVDVVVTLSHIVLEFYNVVKDLSRPVSLC